MPPTDERQTAGIFTGLKPGEFIDPQGNVVGPTGNIVRKAVSGSARVQDGLIIEPSGEVRQTVRPGEGKVGDVSTAQRFTDPDLNTPLGQFDFFTGGSADRQREQDLRNLLSQGEPDRDLIRRRVLDDFSERRKAIENVFNQQLAQIRRRNQAETERDVSRTTAIIGRRGLTGSPRGVSQVQNVKDVSAEILANEEARLAAEKASALSGLLGEADKIARAEFQAERDALLQGRESLIQFLQGQDERKQANLNTVVSSMIARGIDPAELGAGELEGLASRIGVPVANIVNLFETQKAEQQQVEDAEREGFTLSSGEQRFDAEGNLIASVAPRSQIGTTTLTFRDSEGNSSQRLVRFDKSTGEIISDGDIQGNVFVGTARSADGSSTPSRLDDPDIQESLSEVSDLTKAVMQGIVSLDDLSPSNRADVASELARSGQKIGSDKVDKTLKAVQDLLDFENRKRFTGFSSLAPALPGTKRFLFEKKFDNLKGLLTLENLGLMTGVLSDTDIKIIQDASTALDIGLGDEAFEAELQSIADALNRKITPALLGTNGGVITNPNTGRAFGLPNEN